MKKKDILYLVWQLGESLLHMNEVVEENTRLSIRRASIVFRKKFITILESNIISPRRYNIKMNPENST